MLSIRTVGFVARFYAYEKKYRGAWRYMLEIKITENESGQRLDRFLRKYLKEYSLGDIYKLFRKNKVKVNRMKAKESYMLALEDVVQLYIVRETAEPESKPPVKARRSSELQVLYEDDNILIVNKPIGVLTHPDKPGDTDTLIDRALGYMDQHGGYERSATFTPAPCNRLDRNTGGVVIIAKNYKSLKTINEAIRERWIKKLYLCVIKGKLDQKGELKGYLVKDEASNKVEITSHAQGEGKPVHTKYETVEVSEKLEGLNEVFSLLQVDLITGRSHQIRAHFSGLGHPLIGDAKYGAKRLNDYFKKHFDLDGQFLFAYRLEFHQIGEELNYLSGRHFVCPLPRKLDRMIEELFNKGV